tara:strand:- start:1842 stop:3848 length:2007 start_codon:yes stop_codon:yes gene_type:complete
MPILYTNTNPYQPNGYTPIQYGTGNGVQGNEFQTNWRYQPNGIFTNVGLGNGPDNPFFNTFPYQDNGYAPIQVGTGAGPIHNQYFNIFHYQHNGPFPIQYGQGIGPDNPFFNTNPYQLPVSDPLKDGRGIGPDNPFFNTFHYEDNVGTQILKPGIGPDNPFYNTNPYGPEGKPDPEVGTADYADHYAELPVPETVFKQPNTFNLIGTYPNAGTNPDISSKIGISEMGGDINGEDILRSSGISLASGLTSNTAITGLIGGGGKQRTSYKLLSKDKIKTIQDSFLPYYDFRREIGTLGKDTRVDGAAALLRGSALAGAYSAASLAPGGAYSVFNLESTYGFGSYTGFNPQSKKDFTLRSNVATRWQPSGDNRKGGFIQTINPIEIATQFRGDKVNVIDFGQKSHGQIYKWRPPLTLNETSFGAALDALGSGTTRDLVKFYFTGPKLTANPTEGTKDDVLVFRAMISSLTDTFNASWNPVKYIGRADPNYTYQGYGRQFDVNFTVYASDRDEMKPMYRKLNYLASYTAPTYSDDTLTMEAPWLRITIGDLLIHQPVVLTSVYYTFVDSDTTWETNLVKDPMMMQAPFKVEVSVQFNVITDYLPQKGGRMYSLASRFDKNSVPKAGGHNWLSDAEGSLLSENLSNKDKFIEGVKAAAEPFTDAFKKITGVGD